MPSRNRDYAAERARRDARSIERYGVTYNQREHLERKASRSAAGNMSRSQVRDMLTRAKETNDNPRKAVSDLISRRIAAQRMKSDGQEIPPDYFDDIDMDEVDERWLWYH